MPAQKRLTPNSAYRAIQYLAREWYPFLKKYDFEIPEKKKELREFAEELRIIVEEAIELSHAPVMKPINFVQRMRDKDKERLDKGEMI